MAEALWRRATLCTFALLGPLSACSREPHESPPPAASAPSSASRPSVSAPVAVAAPAPTRTAPSPAPPPLDLDAGSLACRPLRPIYIDPSFIAPVVLRIEDRAANPVAQLVFNDGGIPRIVTIPFEDPAKPAAGDASDLAPLTVTGRTKSTLPACAAAGDVLFCPDATGAVHAWRGEIGPVVVRARAGTDIAAAAVGEHVALAYVAERVTTEGLLREAWVTLDEGPPVRLSEGGSGATFVELAPRGSGLLAMTIDARVAMTPAHARPIGIEEGKLVLGADAVVFVGGSAETHNAGALATSKDGSAFELIAVADGAAAFGMSAIRLDDPPRDDESVVWSYYPNGLDPAPIAATHGGASIVVARVRPRTAEPKATRVLEIGDLSRDGAFSARCILDEAPFIKDVEIEQDRQGALWVFYRDPRGSVLERRALPSPSPSKR